MSSTTRTANARSKKHRSKSSAQVTPDAPQPSAIAAAASSPADGIAVADPAPESDGPALCFICAEPVKFWSVSECNHRTCHVCALRLRALYKRMDCTYCKHRQPLVIFTSDPDKPFSDYTPDDIPFKDPKLSIAFETQEMMEESLILLRFNCPDPSCDFIANGWNDLKMHVRALHGRQLCDLCIKHKKIFSHEHALYTHSQLSIHLPSYSRRQHQSKLKDKPEDIEGGIHPFCDFCQESFFGDDELYAHMRERHEECFVCKRGGIQHQHFADYPSLERHFNVAHHPCTHPTCQAQKFVVFGSKLDHQAHMVETHQQDMSAKGKKEARRVVDGFEFESARPTNNRNNHRPPGGGEAPAASARQNRREAFGATLSSSDAFPSLAGPSAPQQPETISQPTELVFEVPDPDLGTLQRHKFFLDRVGQLTQKSAPATASIKAAIRSYRTGESGARHLISTMHTVLKEDLDSVAGLFNLLVDLIDDEDKRRDLLGAWNGFKIEQHQLFPELVPERAGTSYSGISSGRVINVKKSTLTKASTSRMLDRVANAATSSSSFPALGTSLATKPRPNAPSWTPTGSGTTTPAIRPFSTPGSGSQADSTQRLPKLSSAQFPSLPPPSGTALEVRQLVSASRRESPGVENAWTKGGASQAAGAAGEEGDVVQGRGKKKKGKEKQMLFSIGTFPT